MRRGRRSDEPCSGWSEVVEACTSRDCHDYLALGGTYSVLGRRRGVISKHSLHRRLYYPRVPSGRAVFGFADELRHSSSGASSAQLMLSHWEHLEVDPFFTPKTEEEGRSLARMGTWGRISLANSSMRLDVEKAEYVSFHK